MSMAALWHPCHDIQWLVLPTGDGWSVCVTVRLPGGTPSLILVCTRWSVWLSLAFRIHLPHALGVEVVVWIAESHRSRALIKERQRGPT
ncbi:unnamed protein product [Vitrella brassicaformis CCMP3155]|uniref:Uncharacterized protein n=1 Tax=Vitrella brassicaformis (strain CCMP3155) TaxID=1169540 RepID=A0A0G4GLS7_VITBC|nr:unnamed protein product [Vitrella brassicaformis CCMP3155]|eukprot:CEM31060.1 unnamed protein product [Vitrella brassicaformis CCMP3155]